MAFAKLQPWHPQFGLHCFISSALRCLSNQPLQSQRKCWQVSSLGRVCSTHGIISSGTLDAQGYRVVTIAGQMWKVHRVVKLTHHGFPTSREAWLVHHRDGNKANNALDNLEYVTPSQNQLYSYATSQRQDTWHIQSRPVLFRVLGGHEDWTSCPSITFTAKQLGIPQCVVSRCCRNNLSAKGYEFRFRDLEEQETNQEEWRPMLNPSSGAEVPGRSVSSFGRIKSLHGHVSRGYLRKTGYYEMKLQGQSMLVHRLVAFAFLGPPPSGKQNLVNHRDLNKGNNAVENLEYVTPAENTAHYFSNVGFNREAGFKPVWSRVRGSSDVWTLHASMSSAARTLAVKTGNISQCASGQRKHTGGYEFRLADAQESRGSAPGEIWREVDVPTLLRDREWRK